MHMSKKCRMTPTEIAPLIPSSRNSDSVCVRTVEKVLARYEIFKDVKDIDKSVYRQVCLLFAPKRREQSEERTIRANRYCFAFQLPSDPRIYTGLHATFLRRGNCQGSSPEALVQAWTGGPCAIQPRRQCFDGLKGAGRRSIVMFWQPCAPMLLGAELIITRRPRLLTVSVSPSTPRRAGENVLLKRARVQTGVFALRHDDNLRSYASICTRSGLKYENSRDMSKNDVSSAANNVDAPCESTNLVNAEPRGASRLVSFDTRLGAAA